MTISNYIQRSYYPPELRQQVVDFINWLKQKANAERHIKERQFGYAKNAFKMSDDFDEPLDDFKEYI